MKKLSLFFISILFILQCFARNTKNIVTDFGADSLGKTNSDNAFKKAAAFFKANSGNGTLIIPYGVYIVGRQLESPYPKDFQFSIQSQHTGSFEGSDVFVLNNCSNFDILGQRNAQGQMPIIRFESGLKFGVFDAVTHKASTNLNDNVQANNGQNTRAHVGIIFVFRQCDNIKIEAVELDGNYNDFNLGGNWPTIGNGNDGKRQIENVLYGVFICESRNVICKNLLIHHFLNGIYLTDLWENIALKKATPINYSSKIYILNSRLSSNIQNNFCFAGADSVFCDNTIFELAARDIVGYSPGAGVGIEPEGNVASKSSNGYFTNCTFRNNAGFGVGAGSYTYPVVTKNFTFERCTFIGTKNLAVNASAQNLKFNKCKFYGKVQSIGKFCFAHNPAGICQEEKYFSNNYETGTSFTNCSFSDQYYGYPTEVGGISGSIHASFLSENTPYLQISNCNFKAYNSYNFSINGILDSKGNYSTKNNNNNFVKFFNNEINNHTPVNTKGIKFPIPNKLGIMANTIFYKNNFLYNKGLDITAINSTDMGGNIFKETSEKNEPLLLCAPVIDLYYPVLSTINLKATEYIIAESKTLLTGKSKMTAGEYITLLPGFEVSAEGSVNSLLMEINLSPCVNDKSK